MKFNLLWVQWQLIFLVWRQWNKTIILLYVTCDKSSDNWYSKRDGDGDELHQSLGSHTATFSGLDHARK